ncbi:hypothetical protein V5799_021942, partial [Amblyomma americanum]
NSSNVNKEVGSLSRCLPKHPEKTREVKKEERFLNWASSAYSCHDFSAMDDISRELEEAPDALKLMQSGKGKFYLVYHSKNESFKDTYPCLRAVRRQFDKKSGKATYQYEYGSGKQVTTNHRQVSVDKTDEAYPLPNEFSMDLNYGGSMKKQDFQIIYSDFTNCALLLSWGLGYQVWVESRYLAERRIVPPLCSRLYNLLAEGEKKHVVYNWRNCPIRQQNQDG